jgi:hypothetical protein
VSSWFLLEFEADWAGDQPAPEQEPELAGGGRHFTFLPIVKERIEARVPGSLLIARQRELRFQGSLDLIPYEHPVEARFDGHVHIVRQVEIRFSGTREPAHRYGTIMQEDEEILLLS